MKDISSTIFVGDIAGELTGIVSTILILPSGLFHEISEYQVQELFYLHDF